MIGIFDSGLGGLFVLREACRQMPGSRFVYAADCGRAPYGGLQKPVLWKYACELVGFLHSKGCERIIAACGTVSSNCMGELREYFPTIEFMDVIAPLVSHIAMHAPQEARLGILATHATVQAGRLQCSIFAARPDCAVRAIAAPRLVPFAESDRHNSAEAKAAVREYCKALGDVDVVVLGCTHYPMFLDELQRCVGDVPIISPHDCTAQAAQTVFGPSDREALSDSPQVEVFASGDVVRFSEIGRSVMEFEAVGIDFALNV